MTELYLLEQLDAFARTGTLSAAAKELHITQPALTRSMKKIEEEYGMTLFHREGRKISLNEGGEIAARFASRILEDEREMTRELSRWERSQKTVTIGSCAPLPISRLMPALQAQFRDKSIISEICDSDEVLLDRLRAGDMQVVILHKVPDVAGLFCQRYIQESICIFVPENHPLYKKKSVTLKELSQYSILVEQHIGFWLPLCQKMLPSSSLLIQNSIDAMDELAESSNIAMFNSDAMIQDGFASGGRKAIPITDACMHATYYVVCKESDREKLRTLYNAVRAEVLREV